jgi:hypothetical protein
LFCLFLKKKDIFTKHDPPLALSYMVIVSLKTKTS